MEIPAFSGKGNKSPGNVPGKADQTLELAGQGKRPVEFVWRRCGPDWPIRPTASRSNALYSRNSLVLKGKSCPFDHSGSQAFPIESKVV